eukprot:CAMPEP_0172544992 /NCGR_PEP_ID=MMETSP1067-20121228/15029_1 /TAXON_ID=265564 ORGANISM="Thalassiosira punctigera, Strain Tpunct2005C2" /NCGR_SAMPLE_ID=MMETSP1067 /ASSEMBLY_ACC=CAM_ASM_000444 /LENGTH=33 /DNA_ID= /DNA_START= /DNA_END= /DNA_ORIENTATION=
MPELLDVTAADEGMRIDAMNAPHGDLTALANDD